MMDPVIHLGLEAHVPAHCFTTKRRCIDLTPQHLRHILQAKHVSLLMLTMIYAQGALRQTQAGLLLGCFDVMIEDCMTDATGVFPSALPFALPCHLRWLITDMRLL